MKKIRWKAIAVFMVLSLLFGAVAPMAYASEVTADPVQEVIAQLEAIDTLEAMQNKRSEYTVKNAHYDTGTTNTAVIEEHETARAAYESYVSEMFAARIAAKQAYDALTEDQKGQIDDSLISKLNDELPTKFMANTYGVTPSDDAYTFEAVDGEPGLGYEVSNYMVSGNIPQTFVLVDTTDGKTSWTPNGRYVYGESNYEVAYCCDVETSLEYSTDYKRVNLEDSNYYSAGSAKKIRAILQNSYPYVSMDEMKANLISGGMDKEFVNSLNRADMIAAVQLAVWTYANVEDMAGQALSYFASVNIPKNTGIYFTPIHDYSNEIWDWLPGKRQRSYDGEAAYRVNNLAYYLCNLKGVEADDDQIVINDVKIARADLIPGTDGEYTVGMYIYLNEAGKETDDLKVTVYTVHENGDGTFTTTRKANQPVNGRTEIAMSVKANSGDKIKVLVEGTQTLAKGVYFYEPEGGRDASQSLVGVGEGVTKVRTEKEFVFKEEIGEAGLRIYKTDKKTGNPLSDIVFHIYKVICGEGDTLSETPTPEEIEKYAVEANKVGSVTTDVTGYAAIALEEGTYLVVEEHNEEKVVEPIAPFYMMLPVNQEITKEDGTTVIEKISIVSVYPKNEEKPPEEEEPTPPTPPDNVKGKFEILKHDENDKKEVLKGASFEVYRAATTADTETKIVTANGMQYAVVPVKVNGETLTLITDANGQASSPELLCGTYFLVETKAPAGYNLLEEAVIVTIASGELAEIPVVEIGNVRGNILPETGGMGTTIFTTMGLILVLSAGILFVTRRRMEMK